MDRDQSFTLDIVLFTQMHSSFSISQACFLGFNNKNMGKQEYIRKFIQQKDGYAQADMKKISAKTLSNKIH